MNNTAQKLVSTIALLIIVELLFLPMTNVNAGDHSAPLFANGDLLWAKGVGGIDGETPLSITTDTSGNIYITGLFTGTVDFDPGIGVTNLTASGISNFSDGFVAKYSENGALIWAKQMDGTGGDAGKDVVLDTNGNVYVTGYFSSTVDFDPGAGIFNITSAGQTDVFILKLSPNGDFLWAKSMGGTSYDEGYKIKLENAGNIYLLAQFWGTSDHNPNLSTFNLTSMGMGDVSITKLDSSGNFVWAKGFGGTSDDYANSFIIGPTENLYITGNFGNTVDFNPNAGVANRTSNEFYDMFVSALDKDGQFLWAISIGGSGIDDGTDIELGSNEDVYVSGSFEGAVDFDPGAGTSSITGVGEDDIYILKLDKNGNYGWVSAVGSSGVDYANDIEIDSDQNIYITGSYSNTIDFDPFAGTTNLTSAGGIDIFLSKFNNSGQLLWAKSMGGTLNDNPYGFEIDAANNLFLAGSFRGTADFDPGAGILNLTSAGLGDIFLAKLEGDASTSIFSITRTSTSPTSAINVDFTVTFSEDVTGVSTSAPFNDFSLITSGVTGAAITAVTPVSASVYTVTVNTGSGNGTIRLDIPSSATITDLSSNALSGLPFTSGETYSIQKQAGSSIQLGGVSMGSYSISPGTSQVVKYALDGGPVVFSSGDGADIIASLNQWRRRATTTVGWTGVSQSMALPVELITNKYVMPRYDYSSTSALNNAILLANVDTVSRDINVTIGGTSVNETYTIGPSDSEFVRFPGIVGGPVVVSSDTGAKIVASLYELIRDPSAPGWNGQSEMMGLPWSQVSDQYLIPIYFGAASPNTLKPSLYIANVDTIPTTVEITIAGVPQVPTYPLAANTSMVVSYALDGGPVEISSNNGADLVASLNQWRRRATTKVGWTGVSQSMALPVELITDRYVLPRYDYTNTSSLNNAILLANVDTVTRDITVTIGGTSVNETYTIGPSGSEFVRFPGVVGGPVVVSSDTGARIVASLYELIRDPSAPGWNGQSEMMGLPWSLLSDEYLIPMYFGASSPNTLNPSLYIAVP